MAATRAVYDPALIASTGFLIAKSFIMRTFGGKIIGSHRLDRWILFPASDLAVYEEFVTLRW